MINVGSVGGKICSPMGGLYCSTKHAVEALSDTLRMEMPWLSVSLVQPAIVATEILNKKNPNKGWAFKLEGEMATRYKALADFIERMDAVNLPLASPPSATSAVILDAVTSPFPKTRYTCANVGGVPAWLLLLFKAILGDRVWDFLTLQAADKAVPVTIAICSGLAALLGGISLL